MLSVAAGLPASATVPATASPQQAVIVRSTSSALPQVEESVRRLGGQVGLELPLIEGFAARVPATALAALRTTPGVQAVTPDATGRLMGLEPALGYDTADAGSLQQITEITGAQAAWKAGYTGKGIDVALLDSGVAPVPGLTSGNVLRGPDLSFDSQDRATRYVDRYGHGTHMAGLIAGRDAAAASGSDYVKAASTSFVGVAPDARVVSVKVGAANGAVDVSQVIAGIDWVVQHAKDPGMNIRVISLSYGTDSTQSYTLDPLSHAAEQAWRHGIVVVVSGGNDGRDNRRLANPAYDPYLLAVGASDPRGTTKRKDDTVPDFSSHGTVRHVDLIAPGVSVLGLRSPDSHIDTTYPTARVGSRFFRGSGTSQATAITAGAAALLLQRYPTMVPDQVKAQLQETAYQLPGIDSSFQGDGIVDVHAAQTAAPIKEVAARQRHASSDGGGSLELARGTDHVSDEDGTDLTGEVDIFGTPFVSTSIAAAERDAKAWDLTQWNGNHWIGDGWTDTTDGDSAWSGRTWSGRTWSGRTWSGRTWSGRTWSGRTWSGRTWSDAAWQ